MEDGNATQESESTIKMKLKKFAEKVRELNQVGEQHNEVVEVEISNEEIEEFKEERLDDVENFEKIGFARPLGGYFYQFAFAILGGVIIFALFGTILEVVYPYPTAKGYTDAAKVLFSFVQFMFNIPTQFAIERFLSEWRIKNPDKMVEYIRFYIWYQMLTGLILVTSLSWYVLAMLSAESGLEYAQWLLLVLITREYPAMLNLFMQCIKGLQQFDKEAQIYFTKDIITKGCEIGFVILGRLWGEANPRIGGMLGLAIGWAFGTYIDDFINMFIAALYFNKVLKKMGYSLGHVIRPRVSVDVIKTSMWYGFVVSWPGIFSSIVNFFIFFAWYAAVPAYVTLQTLNKTADELANITKRSEGINLKGGLSESYNNGRHKLTQFYIAQVFKWYGFFTTGIGIVVMTFFPALMEIIFGTGDLKTYLLAIPFILPNVIHTITCEGLDGTSKQILQMTNHQMFNSLTEIGHNIASIITTWIYLDVTMIPQRYGIPAMIWIIPMGNFIADFGFMLVRYIYIHKRVVKIKIPVWQAFIAPLPPALITFGVGKLWIATVHVWIRDAIGGDIGAYAAGISTVLFAFVGCFLFLFITLYSYFGGWDDYGLEVFQEAVKISGPSKIFFKPIAKMSTWLISISPFHNKYPIPWKEADREAVELMIIRERQDEQKKAEEIKLTLEEASKE